MIPKLKCSSETQAGRFFHLLWPGKSHRCPSNRPKRRTAVLATIVLVTLRPFVARSSDLPVEVERQLQKQASVMSTVCCKYDEKQSGENTPSFYGGPTSFMACFEGDHFNIRTEMRYPEEKKPRAHEDVYDGKIFYYGDPDRGGNIPAILKTYRPGDKTDPEGITRLYFECLDYAGFYMPQQIAELDRFRSLESLVLQNVEKCLALTIETNSEKLILTMLIPDPLITRAKEINIEQLKKDKIGLNLKLDTISNQVANLQAMQTLVPTRKVIFTLSSKQNYSVLQRDDFTADGKKILSIKNNNWQFYPAAEDGIWLPSRSVANYYTERYYLSGFADKPLLTVTCDLADISFGRNKDIAFRLDYKDVGSLIVDRSSSYAATQQEHYVMYKVAAGGAQLLDTAMSIKSETAPSHIWVIRAILATLLVLPVIFVVRKLRRK